jgi:hypothetical protein
MLNQFVAGIRGHPNAAAGMSGKEDVLVGVVAVGEAMYRDS